MNGKESLQAIGVVCVTILEVTALVTKTDGQVFSLVIGAICSIVGVSIGEVLQKKKVVVDQKTTS